MSSYIIALDLGINNIGWAIIDSKTFEILKYGVAKFEASKGAADRRKLRGLRRLKRRSLHRIERLAQLLVSKGINPQKTYEEKLLEKRIQGLSQQLTMQEIVNIVYYFARHRGYIPFDDTKLERETMVLKDNEYPCEFIKEYYTKHGVYRGQAPLSKWQDNERELRQILKTQSNYYQEIDDNLINDIIQIIRSKREFYEGPGSPREHQLSPYGRYRTKEDIAQFEVNPNYHKYLYEILIGKCRIAIGERCAPALNFYAEEFNFYNDIINTKVKDVQNLDEEYIMKVEKNGRLKRETILEIKEKILTFKTLNVNMETIFKEVLGTTFDNLTGYRINKSGEPVFSTFDFYRKMKKSFSKEGLSSKWLEDNDKVTYNKIIYALTVAPSSLQIHDMLKYLLPEYEFSEKELEVLQSIKKKGKKEEFKYHSLSEKIIESTLSDMDKTNYQYNYMQLLTKFDYEKESREYIQNNYSRKTSEPFLMESDHIDELIANPQVKKTLRKAIAIINAIIKEMKAYPDVIAIESTKEGNSKAQKKRIEAQQKHFEDLRTKAKEFLEEQNLPINETNITKALCFHETNKTCIYCGKKISDSKFTSLEIEHILPLSKSFDNSYNNLTCSCTKCNSEKGNKTPYAYLFPLGRFEDFEKKVKALKLPEKKEENLLTKDDLDKNSIKFINRNLRDTAYASTALADEVKKYNIFLQPKNGCHINTFSTPGQLTAKIRRRLGIEEKDRKSDYHHAVDACIIGQVACTEVGKILTDAQNNRQYWINNKQTIFSLGSYIKDFNIESIEKIKGIKQENIYISYEVKRDPKRELSNQNHIKVLKRNDEYFKVDQINNIYDITPKIWENNRKTLEKLFNENINGYELLCQKEDPKLYRRLKEIYLSSNNEKVNPFYNYCIFAHGLENKESEFNYSLHGIKKSPKKEKSPIVKSLRYKTIINDPYIFQKAKQNTKGNRYNEFIKSPPKDKTLVGLDSLAQYCVEIYYELNKNKFIFLPIYAISIDLNNGIINHNEHYYQQNYQKYIGDKNVKFVGTIQNGECATIIKSDGTTFLCRYSYFDKTNNKLEFDQILGGKEVSMTRRDKAIIIYRTDILGNRYVKLDSRTKI